MTDTARTIPTKAWGLLDKDVGYLPVAFARESEAYEYLDKYGGLIRLRVVPVLVADAGLVLDGEA